VLKFNLDMMSRISQSIHVTFCHVIHPRAWRNYALSHILQYVCVTVCVWVFLLCYF